MSEERNTLVIKKGCNHCKEEQELLLRKMATEYIENSGGRVIKANTPNSKGMKK